MTYPKEFFREPLTEDERKKVTAWENAADPFERMLQPYYPLMRRWLQHDYYAEITEAKDLEEMRTAKDDLLRKMEILAKDYEKDLQLCIELMLSVGNSFRPAMLMEMQQKSPD